MEYKTVPLNRGHKKQDFTCGKELLDNYLQKQAKQDVKRKLTACFLLPDENQNVVGYYTLSSAAIPREIVPEEIRDKLPKSYNHLPATLLGRLAVNQKFSRQGFGELLLIDALKRSYDISISSIGSMAVIVDPIDIQAVNFYSKYGFITLPDSEKMFIPMKTIAQLF